MIRALPAQPLEGGGLEHGLQDRELSSQLLVDGRAWLRAGHGAIMTARGGGLAPPHVWSGQLRRGHPHRSPLGPIAGRTPRRPGPVAHEHCVFTRTRTRRSDRGGLRPASPEMALASPLRRAGSGPRPPSASRRRPAGKGQHPVPKGEGRVVDPVCLRRSSTRTAHPGPCRAPTPLPPGPRGDWPGSRQLPLAEDRAGVGGPEDEDPGPIDGKTISRCPTRAPRAARTDGGRRLGHLSLRAPASRTARGLARFLPIPRSARGGAAG